MMTPRSAGSSISGQGADLVPHLTQRITSATRSSSSFDGRRYLIQRDKTLSLSELNRRTIASLLSLGHPVPGEQRLHVHGLIRPIRAAGLLVLELVLTARIAP